MAKQDFDIRYDRVVSETFLSHFLPGGVAASLAPMARGAAFPLDLQMRKDPKTLGEWATVYAGLTAVLNVRRRPGGRFRLDAHPTWSGVPRYRFGKSWVDLDESGLREAWNDVELYLERVIPAATKSHGVTEGAVQAAVSKSKDETWVMLDREVTPSFRDQATKTRLLRQCWEPIVAALPKDLAAGKVPTTFGAECDLLALRPETGQVVAVEIKPYDGAGIAWVAAQATMYASVLNVWIDLDATAAATVAGTIEQRQRLGLSEPGTFTAQVDKAVQPVVVLQRGASQVSKDRMLAVRDALPYDQLGVAPVEIHEVSITGELTLLG